MTILKGNRDKILSLFNSKTILKQFLFYFTNMVILVKRMSVDSTFDGPCMRIILVPKKPFDHCQNSEVFLSLKTMSWSELARL